ncbi:MAG: isoprenylcysteine carboxylmethyltransferase family protein [Oscillospiraceae bacterium]|nr:isoprenylcysteine carboxylmethyltransferase family protein [Oscillospiraceae bacterium]MDD4368145.1 isoprenylcysteine carboxylmethyltransferase family protein [Oscillospiraceae bacterium]
MKKQHPHLPLFGPGPIYVSVVIALTTAACYAVRQGWLRSGHLPLLRLPFFIAASLLIPGGVVLWLLALFQSKIETRILRNQLVTDGVYAWVRNPIYSSFLFICSGVLLLAVNLWLLILPVCFWLFLTLLLRQTEEKWLQEAYGADYKAYCARTNRCLPWPPHRQTAY